MNTRYQHSWLSAVMLAVLMLTISTGASILAPIARAAGLASGSPSLLPSYLRTDYLKQLHRRAILARQAGGPGPGSAGSGAGPGQQTPRDLDITFVQNTGASGNQNAPKKPQLPLANGQIYSDTEPAFAPDRHTIYFASNRPDPLDPGNGGFHLWTMDSDGSFQQPLKGTMGMDQQWPAFSADGNNIAYSSRTSLGGAPQIHVLNLNSGMDYTVTSGPGNKTHPTWSRSNIIAYQNDFPTPSNATGLTKVWVVLADLTLPDPSMSLSAQLTGTGVDATNSIAIDSQPSWEPSGLHVAFTRNLNTTGSTNRIWLVSNITFTPSGAAVSGTAFPLTDFVDPKSGAPSDDQYPSWRPQGKDFSSLTDNPDDDSLAFSSNRKSSPDPVASQAGATSIGATYGIYRVPIAYQDQSQRTPFTETQAQQQTDPNFQFPVNYRPAVVVAEDTQHPPFVYSNIASAWSPAQLVDPITSQTHTANRIVYASNAGILYGLQPPQPFTDIWSSEIFDFTPPALVNLPTVTPRLATPGQPVTIAVHVADLNAGVAHLYVQMKNPNSYLQDTRLPSLRNSVTGQDVFLPNAQAPFAFLPFYGDFDNTVPFDPTFGFVQPVVFDGHRVYQVIELPHSFTAQKPDSFYHTAVEIGYQPIHPQTLLPDGTPDPNAYSYADIDVNGNSQENIPFDLTTLDVNGIATGLITSVDTAPPDSLELKQDASDPTLYTATWVTDPSLDTDYILDVIGVDRVGNAIDYDNTWGFSTRSFAAGNNPILLVADYVTPQEFLAPKGSDVPGISNGVESWLTDNPLSKLGAGAVGVNPAIPNGGGGDRNPPPDLFTAPANNVDRLNLVTPGSGIYDFTKPAPGQPQPNYMWGFVNTLGRGSWINVNDDSFNFTTMPELFFDANGSSPPGDQSFLGFTFPGVNSDFGWPAPEDSFDPNQNLDGYDIWRILCRGPIPNSVINSYGPVTVTEPDPTNVLKRLPKQTHPRCVVWASPFTADEFVGPGTILDPVAQATIQQFLNGGGHMFLTGQDIAWALSLADPTSTVPSHNFLRNYFGVQFQNDVQFPLGDPINNNDGGPIGGRWGGAQGTGGPDAPLDALAHFFQGDISRGQLEYDTFPNYVGFGARNQDFPDTVSPQMGAVNDYTQTAGGVDVVSVFNPMTNVKTVYSAFGIEGIDDGYKDLSWTYKAPDPKNVGKTIDQPVKQYGSQNERAILMHGIVDWLRENTVTGQVNRLDPNGAGGPGAPFANALIVAVQDIPNGAPVAYALSRSDGSFTLAGIPTGQGKGGQTLNFGDVTGIGFSRFGPFPKVTYRREAGPGVVLLATRPGFTQDHTVRAILGHAGENKGGVSLLLDVAPPGTIKGTVTDAQTGKPIQGATVSISNVPFSDIQVTGTTDVRGNYSIQVPATAPPIPGLPQSSYVIVYSAPGYSSLTKTKDDATGGPILAPSQSVQTENAQLSVLPGPGSLTAVGGNGVVTLSFSPIQGALSYNIKRSTIPGGGPGGYATIANITTTSYQDTNVTNGVIYYYVVTAVTPTGETPASNEASATPQPPPDAPTNLRASPGNGTVTLTWNAANRATTYNVKRSPVTGGPYTLVASGITATTYTDSGLTNGTPYFYVVTASNGAGEGPPSNEASSTPIAPPPAPLNLKAQPGSALVTLTWTGSVGANVYNVKRSATSGGPYTLVASGIATTSYTDTTVTNGVTYYYVVSAMNGGGEGTDSNEASATPMAPPLAPTNLTATAGNRQITLSWTASPGANFYNIKRSPTSGGPYALVSSNVTTTTFTDIGLAQGTPYFYVVTAVNVGGESPNSNEATATPPSPPPATTNVAAVAGNQQVTITWTASPNATSYSVKRSTTAGGPYNIVFPGITGTSYTEMNLTPGVTYFYVVSALNAAGESPNSTEVSGTPPTPPPGTITLNAAPSNAQVTLTWNLIAGATSYNLKRSNASGGPYSPLANNVTSNSFTDTAVANGTTYYYVIAPVNVAGEGALSNQTSATPMAPPGAPANLSATPTTGQIALAWTASPRAASYNVKRSNNSGGPYTTIQSGIAATVFNDTNVARGTTYFYVVTAVNVGGESANSNEASASPPTPPPAPTNLAATGGNSSVFLTWNVAAGATSYNVKQSLAAGGPYTLRASNVTTTSFTDTGLTNGVTYFYVVSAVNAGGEGPNSNEASAIPPVAPGATTIAVTPVSGTEIDLSWTAVSGASAYQVQRRTGGGSFTQIAQVGGNSTTYQDKGLTPNTQYTYQVVAVNVSGASPASNTASATTLAVPGAPSGLTATAISGAQVTLAWADLSNDAASFKIERVSGGGAFTQIATVGGNTLTYTDNTVSPNSTYTYRIRATNANGDSPYSNLATVTTGTDVISGMVQVGSGSVTSPVPGVTVSLLDSAGRTILKTATTDQAGRYAFSSLTDGTYTIQVTAIGQTQAPTAQVTVTASVNNGAATQNFTLTPLNVFPSGLSMASVPFDYSGTSVTAASVFGVSVGTNGSAAIANYDPLANTYKIYPSLNISAQQTVPGYGYWIKEATATPFLTAGKPVSSPLEITLQPGWTIIGDPYLTRLDLNTLQVRAPLQVGSNPANTLLSLQTAINSQLIGSTVWGYSQTTNTYVAATSLQPFLGYWIFVNPAGANNMPVILRFTNPGS